MEASRVWGLGIERREGFEMILRNFTFSRVSLETAKAWRMLDELCVDLRSILNGKLTFSDNFLSERKKLQIDTSLDYTMVLTTALKPTSVLLLGARNLATNDGRVLTGNVVEWEWRGENVLVHSVTGLAASSRYEVELLILEK